MHPIFSVTSSDIKQLNDEQSRELVARLCKAECRLFGASESCVEWGGDQRANDGGIDVHVAIGTGKKFAGFLPRNVIGFQVKAETFSASKISKEMKPKGIFRNSIVSLADLSGAYIIASTRDNCARETGLQDRLDAMEEVLVENGIEKKIKFDFYHARKLADWTERHPQVVVWLKHTIRRPLTGWQPYSAWAFRENDVNVEYLIDDCVKVVTPQEQTGTNVSNALNQLREELQTPRSAIRLVGMSGVGKTRLIQALFDKRIATAAEALSPNQVIYTDLSDNPSPQPNLLVRELVNANSTGILVVDNCGAETHERLAETIQMSSAEVSIITIEFDIRNDEVTEATSCYRLDTSSDEVIYNLLLRKYENLSGLDAERIVKFAGGNSRIAMALANTSESKGQIAKLENPTLFARLFYQKQGKDTNLLRSAEICSLLYSFDVEIVGDDSELTLLASIAETSNTELFRNVAELFQRGIAQKRGRWRAVLPHAIANRLAEQAIENTPVSILEGRLANNQNRRIAKSFARRLSYLHNCEPAKELVGSWLKIDGKFGDIRLLDGFAMELFCKIASVDQAATLDAIHRGTVDLSKANQLSSGFVTLAISLAYEPEFFEKAVEVLVRFAKLEPIEIRRNSISDAAGALFQCCYSGTHATPKQRADIVRQLMGDTDLKVRRVGLDFLSDALKTSEFQNYHGFDFGAHQRNCGWWPSQKSDFQSWFRMFIAIGMEFGKVDSCDGFDVRKIVANSYGGLWEKTGLHDDLVELAQVFKGVDGWTDGWAATKLLLKHSSDLDSTALAKLKKVNEFLAPSDLATEVRALVLSSWSYSLAINDEENGWGERSEKIKELGSDCGLADSSLLLDLLPELLHKNDSRFISSFGAGVGETIHDIVPLLHAARDTIPQIKPHQLELRFLFYLVSSWSNRVEDALVANLLDFILNDDVLGAFFPKFQYSVEFDCSAFERLRTSIQLGVAKAYEYQVLSHSQTKSSLSGEQFETLISLLCEKEVGMNVAADVLWMSTHEIEKETAQYQQSIFSCCKTFLKKLDEAVLLQDDYSQTPHFVYVLKHVLSSRIEEREAMELLNKYLSILRNPSVRPRSRRGKLLEPFFENFAVATLDKIYQPDEAGEFHTSIRFAKGVDNDRGDEPIAKVPPVELIQWCGDADARFEFAIKTCPIFKDKKDDAGETKTELTEFAKTIVEHSPDKFRIIELIYSRISPTSWCGSRVPIIRRRTALLSGLNPTADEDLEKKINSLQDELNKFADGELLREEKSDREDNERFE